MSGFIKKLWKDRLSAFPKQYKMTEISADENSKTVELELQDGTVLTQGDRFNAATMNDLEDRIEAGFNSIVSGVTSFNNRQGDVTPGNSDYTSDMIGHTNTDNTTSTVQAEINGMKTAKVDVSQLLSGGDSGAPFIFDEHNGVYGWNGSDDRDESTFHPFASGGDVSSEEMADVVNILGAKNFIQPNFDIPPLDQATVTTNSDGSLEVNGAIEQGTIQYLISKATLPKGDYILTTGQTYDPEYEENAYIIIYAKVGNNEVAWSDSIQSDENIFSLSQDTEVAFWIRGYNGFDDDITIYPMCRPVNISSDVYTPYAKTNHQLTETVLKQTLTAGSTSLTFTDDRITDDCLIKIAPKRWVPPTSASQSGNTVTVTFPEQAADLDVAVLIREL